MTTEIPGMDNLHVIYLAAGHAEVAVGGTHAFGMHEWQKNIEVVEDALTYLAGHAGLPAPEEHNGNREYVLGDVLLVVISHDLDLAATIREVNRHYVALCRNRGLPLQNGIPGWQHGVCIETHFNAPSATAKGPLLIHTTGAASVALAQIAAEEMGTATGLPTRYYLNNWRKNGDGSLGYGWHNFTYPLSCLMECDEFHNPQRAAIIGDPAANDIYGAGVARFIMRLAGVADTGRPAARAMHLGWSGQPIEWNVLGAMGVRAVVTVHAWQLPKTQAEAQGNFWLWRPYFERGWLRRWNDPHSGPDLAFREIMRLWEEAGRPYFDAVQIGNEPNLGLESGYAADNAPSGQEAFGVFRRWWGDVAQRVQAQFPAAQLTTTPMSPAPGLLQEDWFYGMIQNNRTWARWLNVHAYWENEAGLRGVEADRQAFSFRAIVEMYRQAGLDLPVFLSECGMPGWGARPYGEMIAWYWSHLPPEVQYAAPYIWDTPPGDFDAWRLHHTPAADVLIATAPPVPDRYRQLWGDAVPYPDFTDPLLLRWRSLVDSGRLPGPAHYVTVLDAGVTVGVFEKAALLVGGDSAEFWRKDE